MNLTIEERLLLLTLLPKEEDITTIKIVQDLRGHLSFTEQEHVKYKIVTKDNQITWEASDDTVEIKIGERATDVIKKYLKLLNEQKKLTERHINLWNMFMSEEI